MKHLASHLAMDSLDPSFLDFLLESGNCLVLRLFLWILSASFPLEACGRYNPELYELGTFIVDYSSANEDVLFVCV